MMLAELPTKIMKRGVVILLVSFHACVGLAQGTVNFNNNSTTLVSLPGPVGLPGPWPAGALFFGLFIAPAGTTDPHLFSFSGLYATNSGVAAGRFSGGNGAQVQGWAPGTTMSFLVASWSSSLGHDWNQSWMDGNFQANGLFGLSFIGTGAAGGFNGGPIPPLNLFGGTGIQSGFDLSAVGVPEPSSVAVAIVGAAILMLGRRGRGRVEGF